MKISSATLFPHLNSPAQFSCFGTEQDHPAQNLATGVSGVTLGKVETTLKALPHRGLRLFVVNGVDFKKGREGRKKKLRTNEPSD